jgi:hypothetical protein
MEYMTATWSCVDEVSNIETQSNNSLILVNSLHTRENHYITFLQLQFAM